MPRVLAVEESSEQLVAAVWSALMRRGYHVVRSFDLQNAVTHHTQGCGCRYHGTSQGTCQYVVLLAYPPGLLLSPPRAVIIHSHECTSWVKLQPDGTIGTAEAHLLLSALAEASAPFEPAGRR